LTSVKGCAALAVISSRKLVRATYDSLAFRFIAANDHPDHDTIATFRRRMVSMTGTQASSASTEARSSPRKPHSPMASARSTNGLQVGGHHLAAGELHEELIGSSTPRSTGLPGRAYYRASSVRSDLRSPAIAVRIFSAGFCEQCYLRQTMPNR
jgi:hypothetical protein